MNLRLIIHTHSNYSSDATPTPTEILETAKSLGAHAVAITDHDTMEGCLNTSQDMLRIPGVEITTDRGHVVALFVSRVPATKALSEVLQDIRSQGGVSIIAHPLRKNSGLSKQDLDTYKDLYDAVEIYNPKNTPYGNLVGYQKAKEHRKAMTVGSDAHAIETIGRTMMELEVREHSLSAIRESFLTQPLKLHGAHIPPCDCMSCRVLTTIEPSIHGSRWYHSPLGKRIGKVFYLPIRRLIYDKRKKYV